MYALFMTVVVTVQAFVYVGKVVNGVINIL